VPGLPVVDSRYELGISQHELYNQSTNKAAAHLRHRWTRKMAAVEFSIVILPGFRQEVRWSWALTIKPSNINHNRLANFILPRAKSGIHSRFKSASSSLEDFNSLPSPFSLVVTCVIFMSSN